MTQTSIYWIFLRYYVPKSNTWWSLLFSFWHFFFFFDQWLQNVCATFTRLMPFPFYLFYSLVEVSRFLQHFISLAHHLFVLFANSLQFYTFWPEKISIIMRLQYMSSQPCWSHVQYYIELTHKIINTQCQLISKLIHFTEMWSMQTYPGCNQGLSWSLHISRPLTNGEVGGLVGRGGCTNHFHHKHTNGPL